MFLSICNPHHRRKRSSAWRASGAIRACWLCLAVLLSGAALAAPSLRFENPLQQLDQLAHQIGGINSITQDEHGFIWLGGESGLGRFDGKSIKLYQSRADKAGTLPGNFIWELAVDRDRVMWVASDGGLSRYDAATDSFETIRSLGDTVIEQRAATAFAVAEDNTLYVGTMRGFYQVDPVRETARLFIPEPPVETSPGAEQIRDLVMAPDGALWLATAGIGVARFDPATESFDYFNHDQDDANSLAYDNVKALWVEESGRVWMGTYGGGVSVYSPATGDFRHYTYNPSASDGLRSSVVWDIYQDSQGTVWLTLDQGGLARYDAATDSFAHFMHHPYNSATVVSNQLRPIFEDRNGDLWIGAFPSGVSFHNRSRQLFRTYAAEVNNPEGLRHSAVTSLYKDSRDLLWVGTEGGLHVMDPETETFRHYGADPGNPRALAANPVLAIEEDSRGNLWIGTWAGGLHRFDRKTEHFRRYTNSREPGSIGSNFIWDIVEDREGNLWIAAETNGLNLYNRERDNFVSYRHDPHDLTSISGNFIWTFIEDSNGDLLLGTFNGLDRFDTTTRKAHRLPTGAKDGKSVSSVRIQSLWEDSRGLLWIGTQDRGVTLYNPADDSYHYLDVQQGLPASTVSSILEDDHGNMWFATTSGLARLEYDTMTITVYGKEHGLAGSNFNRDASLKDAEGNLYFGSTEGLTIFHPDNLAAQDQSFPVHLTAFRVLNEEVPVGPDSALRKAITVAEEIRLTHKDLMFSFDFAALNYRNTASNRYAYRLEGFDQDWNYVNTQTGATYTNIDPGTYTFRVKASSDNEHWQEAPPVTLVIQPPPWRTWWAYLGYAALAIMAFYFRREHRRLLRSAENYREQSITDPLTGLYNRAGIWQVVGGLYSNAETRRDTAIMLLDIDHFKRINDQLGHDVGDRILQEISQLVLQNVRRGDYFGRWGGEEFILICPSTEADAAKGVAEKILQAVERNRFAEAGVPLEITVSIGVAITGIRERFEEVLKRADVALYEAKTAGRNRVGISTNDTAASEA